MFQPIIIMRIRFAGLFLGLLLTCGSGVSQATSSRLLPFQGRLVDASGKPIPDGVRVVQFQIYSEPLEGKLLWPGEVHRVTVNGGLVNVVLGSKNPLPRDKSDQTDKSFFDQPLFLQITVDANGDGKISDDKLDPPMLPRQSILPVIFATEAAHARQSDFALKLADGSWGDLFSNNDPRTGLLNGARIQPGTIGGDKIATDGIVASNIANFSITSAKLAPREISSDAGEGGVAISSPAVSSDPAYPEAGFRCATPTVVDVTGLTVSLRTTGRPVFLSLIPEVSKQNRTQAPSSAQEGNEQNMIWVFTAGGGNYAHVFFVADGVQVAMLSLYAGPTAHQPISGGSLSQIVPMTRGLHTFKVQVAYRGSSAGGIEIHNLRLVAFEL